MSSRGDLKLFACRSGERFADALALYLRRHFQKVDKDPGFQVGKINVLDFANTENRVRVEATVRGADTYLVQQCFDPTSKRSIQDNAFEALQAVRALKSAGAAKVTLILPEHPWARQDKAKGRETITSRLFADFVQVAGADNLLTSDLHADQITGFYDATRTKIDNLRASHVLLDYIRKIYPPDEMDDLVIMAPDAGGAGRAEFYAKATGSRMAHAHKKRSTSVANQVDSLEVLGEVEEKRIFVIDDMIDTGGSMAKLAQKLFERRAKEIRVACTHGIFNGSGLDKLTDMGVEVIATDTIPRDEDFLRTYAKHLKIITIAPLFAQAVYYLNQNLSLEPVYGE